MKAYSIKAAVAAALSFATALPASAALVLYVDKVNDQMWLSGSTEVTPYAQNNGGMGMPDDWNSSVTWQSGTNTIYNSTQ